MPGWAQYSTPVQQLYMCGSATHPGGGIMGAPGKNAAEKILGRVKRAGDGNRESETSTRYDAIVIGGGVNGLTCAALLGQAGLRTLLLEQRDVAGGCAAEHELAPGFRVPTLAHRTGPLRADVVEELQLYAAWPDASSPQPIRYTALDPGRARAAGLRATRAGPPDAIRRLVRARRRRAGRHSRARSRSVAGVVGSLFTRTPPDVDDPGARRICGR